MLLVVCICSQNILLFNWTCHVFLAYLTRSQLWHITLIRIHKNMFMGQVIWSHFKDWICPVKRHVIWYFWPKKLYSSSKRIRPQSRELILLVGRVKEGRDSLPQEWPDPWPRLYISCNGTVHHGCGNKKCFGWTPKSGNICRSPLAWHLKHYAARRSSKPCSSRSKLRQ